MAQDVMGHGLRYILASQTAPQAGAGPFFGIGGGFPSSFGVCHIAFVIEFGVGIAQHPAGRKTVPEHLAVKHIGNPTRAKFMVFISHGAHVGALQRAAVLHGPRVCPTPSVHGALDF